MLGGNRALPAGSSSVEVLEDHWRWRPEWVPGRACLYWYIPCHDLAAALEPAALRALQDADWLDAVPPCWTHLTLCDVGFSDELGRSRIDSLVRAVRPELVGHSSLRLRAGPPAATTSAVAMPVAPVAPLLDLYQRLRSVTERVIGLDHPLVHGDPFEPHVSLGYVNRPVPTSQARPVLAQARHLSGTMTADSVALVEVTRSQGHYQWAVVEQLVLGRAASADA